MTRKLSLITGATAGLLYVLLLFTCWKAGIDTLASFLTIYAWTPAVFIIIGGGAWWLRNQADAAPDFKGILQYALLAYLIFELCYAVSNYYLFGILDKQLNDQLVQHLLDATKARLAKGGTGKEQMTAVEDLANAGRAPLTLKQTAIGLGQNMLINFLKSLFIATITKQNFIRKV